MNRFQEFEERDDRSSWAALHHAASTGNTVAVHQLLEDEANLLC